MARQNSSSGASTAVSSRAVEPPALLCRMSSRPKCPTAARIARSRLSAVGFGQTRRFAYNTSAEGQQENRRVNIIFDYPN